MFDAWNAVDFSPSDTLSGIGDSLMPAVEGLVSDVQAGAGKLTELAEKVPNAVPDVSALAGMADELRGRLAGLMTGSVSVLCVHPWQQGVGDRKGDYAWLTPENALASLSARCVPACLTGDAPQGGAALVLVVTAPDLSAFMDALGAFNSVFPLRELEQAGHRAAALATLELDKFVIPKAPCFPPWEWLTPGTPSTGAAFEQVTGTVLARMEATKAAATAPLDALKQAGERLQTQLGAAVKKIDALKQAMQGTNASWFGAYLSGDLGELSRDLSLIAPPANAAHKLTAALLFVGSAPQLAYFQETFLPMITMRLDDYKVPGFGLRVSGSFTLKKQDASGDTSSTAKAEKGIKAKTLTVTTQIRYKDESDLRELIRVSEAKGGSGAKVYTIANTTANAAGIRQVVFSDRVSWDEQEGRKCWNVQFTLAEHKSVPERAEARAKAKPASAGQNAGGTVEGATGTGEKSAEEKPGKLMQFLNYVEKELVGDYESSSSETADKK